MISLFFSIAYFVLLIYYRKGWNLSQVTSYYADKDDLPFVSVIIPMRNEEANILNCLKDLKTQKYSSDKFEVIIVDDYSTDASIENVEHSNLPNLILYERKDFNDLPAFKKGALMAAQQKAKGEFILQLDADCRIGSEWIASIVGSFQNTNNKIICGPVKIKDHNSFLSNLQSLEYAGLNAITAAMINYNKPLLANGANLAYHKLVVEGKPYAGHKGIASGDDDLFVQDKGEKYGVHFLKDPRAMVVTKALENLEDIIQQRKRWASKYKHYDKTNIKKQMALVTGFYLILMASFIACLFFGWSWKYFLVSLAVKYIAELSLLNSCSGFYQLGALKLKLLLGQVPHLFYVVYISIASNFGNTSWKGRRI